MHKPIGINYSISDSLALSLYFNIGNFNASRGDDSMTNCLNITLVML